jgi:uncharacterized protein
VIHSFSQNVISQIGYYVYRLIDPRNETTFYVGVGYGNRVFAHVNCSLASFEGTNYLQKFDANNSLEYERIKEINDSEVKLAFAIVRWGLQYAEALLIRDTLIDIFNLNNLKKTLFSWRQDHGQTSCEDLEKRLYCESFIDDKNNPSYIIIKVKDQKVNDIGRLEATCLDLTINYYKAKKYEYILSVSNGVVREVYKVLKVNKNENSNKCSIDTTVASDEVRDKFINKRIPDYYMRRGLANPILYSKFGSKNIEE